MAEPEAPGGRRKWAGEDRLVDFGGEGTPMVQELCVGELATSRRVHPHAAWEAPHGNWSSDEVGRGVDHRHGVAALVGDVGAVDRRVYPHGGGVGSHGDGRAHDGVDRGVDH